MPKTKNLQSLTDGLLRNYRRSFGEGWPRLCNWQKAGNKRKTWIWDIWGGSVGLCKTYKKKVQGKGIREEQGCVCVFTGKHQAGPAGEQKAMGGSWHGYRSGRGSMCWYLQDPANVECPCDKHASTVCLQWAPSWSGWQVGDPWGRGIRCREGPCQCLRGLRTYTRLWT